MSEEHILPSGRKRPAVRSTHNRIWEPAAVCIASGMTTKQTAEKLGLPPGTLNHWRRHPTFKNFVNRLHDESIAQAVGKMAEALTTAADVVIKLLQSESENIKLQASDRVKEWVKLFRNDKLVLEKLETLEKMMSNANVQSLPESV
jgi:thiaminase